MGKVVKKKIESLLLVTEQNRKFCVTMGRKMYAYKKNGTHYDSLGDFIIRPRLKKGTYICNGYETRIYNEESREEYAQSFDEVITYLIKQKRLYINAEEPLTKIEMKV